MVLKANRSKQLIIARDIISKIKYGQYRPGTYLPSENQLTDLYGASRETIRKALNELNDLGLIQKIKGKGSIVLDIQRYTFPISGITSFKELNSSQAMNAQTKVLQNKPASVPEYFLARGVDNDQRATFLERLRIVNGEPSVLDIDYLLDPPIQKVPTAEATNSLYEYLEGQLGLRISYATKEVTVEKPNVEQKKLLNLTDRDMVVAVRSMTYLDDTTLVQLTESYHRPDKFKFTDFARRKRI
ncbi:trehalose operon repressor [Ligilactobacillus acidipiscis]|uniref:trehalose operon repressor n=1 Tax=Ligilactobacillus acidipiscis TaxID=89059 RepID=UPI0029FBFD51|nr:trehalose operon repressor [Ligilactobacillus acidipiscis]MCI1954293.1 trehalose operon repressor [Ligilactobacillus acidipiscis]